MDSNLITAKELAVMYRISVPTLYRQLKNGPKTRKDGSRGLDFGQIPDRFVGGKRFWDRSAALALLENS